MAMPHSGMMVRDDRMAEHIVPFANSVSRAQSRTQAFDLLAAFMQGIGFGNLSFAIESGSHAGTEAEPRWTTLDSDQRARLAAIGFDGHDPIRRFARRARDPFPWFADRWPGDQSEAARSIMLGLNSTSIEAGMTAVAWGAAGRLAIADAYGFRERVASLPAPAADIFFLATAQTFRVMDRMTDLRTQAILTSREVEILQLSAQGLSARAIAARIGIVEATVKFHLQTVRTKLNARNKAQAIARFAAMGVVVAAPSSDTVGWPGRSKLYHR